jgi:hypothetical protein
MGAERTAAVTLRSDPRLESRDGRAVACVLQPASSTAAVEAIVIAIARLACIGTPCDRVVYQLCGHSATPVSNVGVPEFPPAETEES